AAWRLTRFFVRPLHRPCPDEPGPSRYVRALDGDRGGLPHAPRDGADAPVTRVPHDRAARAALRPHHRTVPPPPRAAPGPARVPQCPYRPRSRSTTALVPAPAPKDVSHGCSYRGHRRSRRRLPAVRTRRPARRLEAVPQGGTGQ